MSNLGRAIPALPVRDVDAAVAYLAGTASCPEADFGTREFSTLDVDGNLIEFFR